MPRCPVCGSGCSAAERFCNTCGFDFGTSHRKAKLPLHAGGKKPGPVAASPQKQAKRKIQTPKRHKVTPVAHPRQPAGAAGPPYKVKPAKPVSPRRQWQLVPLYEVVLRMLHGQNTAGPDISGKVVAENPLTTEPQGRDWPRSLLVFSIGATFIIAAIPALAMAAAFAYLLMLFGFGFILWIFLSGSLMLFGRAGRGQRRQDIEVPVRLFRVEDSRTGDTVQVKMKGHLKAGNISLGDIVHVWGRWKGGGYGGQGTLIMERAYNDTTATKVYSKMRMRSAIMIAVSLLFLSGLFSLLASLAQHGHR